MANPIEEDTCPKVLIINFIDDVAKQLVAELRIACQLNPNLGVKPKSSDAKADLIYERAFCNNLSRVHVWWAVFSSARLVYQWWSI